MCPLTIEHRVRDLLSSLPKEVLLVGAAKMRSPEEARAAVEAGLTAIGHNYIQQAEAMRAKLSDWEARRDVSIRWHLIGHLQRNKAKRAAVLFDMIETIDSIRLAEAVNRHCQAIGKVMPVLLEINSGRESNKTGLAPDKVLEVALAMGQFEHLHLQGLMTMGPRFGDPEDGRPYFQLTRQLFEQLSTTELGTGEMRYLSMGMSNTYRVAIEEGANVVRIGTRLFGERPPDAAADIGETCP